MVFSPWSVHRFVAAAAFCFATSAVMLTAAPVEAACGDGVIDCSENCDDANAVAGDGCNQYCRVEYGYVCPGTTAPASLAPIGHWRLDEPSGSVAADDILGNDGTYPGAMTGSAGAVTEQTATAFGFDGIDDYVAIPHRAAYLTDQGTIAFWFNAATVPVGADPKANLWSKDATELGDGGHLSVYLQDSRLKVRLEIAGNGLLSDGATCASAAECAGGVCSGTCSGASHIIDVAAPPAGEWHHIGISFGPAGMAVVMDGASAGTDPYSGGLGTSSGGAGNIETIAIGGGTQNRAAGTTGPVDEFFHGVIDDVLFYDVQLSGADIASIYQSSSCSTPGGACTPGAPAGCGDTVVDPYTEQCDDGNLAVGDGCDDVCTFERCGDGLINDSTETCDDGGRREFDGCDSDCALEPGYSCTGTPSVCTFIPVCGNGMTEAGEVCDTDVANCAADCQRVMTCGDGLVDAGEACDDHNTVGNDGCSATCTVESGWACTVTTDAVRDFPSICNTTCGDTILVDAAKGSWEQCDDGNLVTGDGCDERCQIEQCGDGFIRGTEQCDDGNAVAGDGCSTTCAIEAGFLCPAENGPCIPETTCDPNVAFVLAHPNTNSSIDQPCPFDPTLDANVDGVLDCADGKHIFAYKAIPSFTVTPGVTTIAFDATTVSPVSVIATIEMAAALTEGDFGAQPAGAWTTVATNSTATTLGDGARYSDDLVFPLDAPFSFPGGGLLIRVTYVQGDVEIRSNYDYEPYHMVSMSSDYDGAYPWDVAVATNRAPTFELTDGVAAVCVENGWMQAWNADTAGCNPSTLQCYPPRKPFPQTAVWCGATDGSTSQNCADDDRWVWSSVSRSLGSEAYCSSHYLYRYDYDICSSSGYCSAYATNNETLDNFCESCDDGDLCTSSAFNWTTGCTFSEVSPVSCWDGDPAAQNVGECSDGLDYCRNPGPECIGANYGSSEVCDAVDNDCNATVDDAAATAAACDDANAGTTDSCVAGTCTYTASCAGTDVSCGTTSCADCTALSGWYYTGVTAPCCDTGQSCMCDEYESRTYYCGGSSCAYTLDPVSTDMRTDLATCATCDDANVCTTDSCDLATGMCANVDSGYSASCYTGPAGTEGVGACAGGTQTCSSGVLQACTDVTPSGETCDNFDEDCNGFIDDGSADSSCLAGQGCWSGACDTACTDNSQCAAGEVCYFENGISPGRCAPTTGACDDVVCPGAATCFEGSCTNANCGNDFDCDVYSRCYNSGRCLNTPDDRCDGVQCEQGLECVKGTCAEACTDNAQCDPGSKCFDGYCFPETDPCAGVDCRVDQICWQGGCYEQCLDDTDCVDPGDVCYDEFRCAPEVDPCFDVSCALGDICYEGSCYPDCTVASCVDTSDACYNASRCEVDNCTGVQCSTGEACQGGVCYLVCTDDAICQANDPSDFCYGGFCKSTPCDGVQCAPGEACQGGVCYPTCTSDLDCTALDPSHACYGGICTDDPCAGVLCPTPGEICHGGTCLPYCSGEGTCVDPTDVCYDVDVCATDYTDLCANTVCPTDMICVTGSCYHDCTSNEDCSILDPSHACYGGRCAASACEGIICAAGDVCADGTCYPYCDASTACDDPASVCYENTCRPDPVDPCAGVVCAVGEVCSGGACLETCVGSPDCSNPDHVCYNNECVDPCVGNTCTAEQVCNAGTCYEYCDATDACSNPESICYDNRCVDADDPECDGVSCPSGEVCESGDCTLACDSQTDCGGLSFPAICYQGACIDSTCGSTTCAAGQACKNGVCYEDCSGGVQCSDPNMACYDNRCAASACEAQASTFLANYDTNHIFRRFNRRLFAFQYSTPWLWPRPYRSGADSFQTWAQITAGAGASSNNDALYAKGAARLVFYFDDTIDSYILYLIQGSKDVAQGATEATYGIRIKSVDPELVAMDDQGLESYHEASTGNLWRYAQVNVKTGPSETGGVAIGRFNPLTTIWRIEINGHFSGDIDRWELMNGETGEPITTLQMGEPVSIRSVDLLPGQPIQPEFGVASCETDKLGVCRPGTVSACTNYELTCDQTVFPWGFEICDGLDNTCNGVVDAADTNLRFAIVESTQSVLGANWRPWPTIDSGSDVDAYMNYTPSATDDRLGSTNILREDGTPLQSAGHSYVAMHRDVRTGALSMPMVVGAQTTDAAAMDSFGNTDVQMDIEPGTGGSIEELFVCWYDDRAPAATDDRSPVRFDTSAQRMAFHWDVETRNSALESDSAVIRPVWLEGAAGGTGIVEYGVRFQRDDADDYERRWYRHGSRVADLELTPFLRFRVRVAAAPPEEAYCISDTATANGCPLGRYMCTATGIECSPPADAFCEANCGDADLDGHDVYDPAFCPNGTDCDDFDPISHAGAEEACDGRDNDCDGNIDFQSATVCANGEAECGPVECGGSFVCSCPQGVREEPGGTTDHCVCGEGLAP